MLQMWVKVIPSLILKAYPHTNSVQMYTLLKGYIFAQQFFWPRQFARMVSTKNLSYQRVPSVIALQ